MEDLVAIFGIVGVFGSGAYLLYVILEAIRSRQQSRLTSEFQNKLLDRVGSVQELAALLNSEGGEKLLASFGARRSTGLYVRIIRAVQSGLVLLCVGVALFTYGWWTPGLAANGYSVINMFATISLAIGIGLLLAAAASYGLTKRLDTTGS